MPRARLGDISVGVGLYSPKPSIYLGANEGGAAVFPSEDHPRERSSLASMSVVCHTHGTWERGPELVSGSQSARYTLLLVLQAWALARVLVEFAQGLHSTFKFLLIMCQQDFRDREPSAPAG
eukprot:1549482-Pleurochrysis_carterae.AAC.2